MKTINPYVEELGFELYEKCPKAVLAAIAVSALTCGGDHLDKAEKRLRLEWWALYHAGIVPQRPPGSEPTDEETVEEFGQ